MPNSHRAQNVPWNDNSADVELLGAARTGDDVAFAVLVRRHEPQVARIAIRMLGAGDDAEDVAQETFIRFHGALDQFREDAAVATYVSRIVMNLSLNVLRRRRWQIRRFVGQGLGGKHVLNFSAPDQSDLVVADERKRMLDGALRTLSDDHRAVVVCRMLEDYSTRETADMLGLPEGTVMSRLTRALEKLRTALRAAGLENG